jgi:hypothetical protein
MRLNLLLWEFSNTYSDELIRMAPRYGGIKNSVVNFRRQMQLLPEEEAH